VKDQHLLDENQMIADETMLEEKSFLLPLPPPSVRARRSPQKPSVPAYEDDAPSSPTKNAHIRGRTPRKASGQTKDQADVTLDIRDMMARVSRPKRASGTEESFEDLLRADDYPDMDM
jgi:hypothetical protein